jgi:hypothetical protein
MSRSPVFILHNLPNLPKAIDACACVSGAFHPLPKRIGLQQTTRKEARGCSDICF